MTKLTLLLAALVPLLAAANQEPLQLTTSATPTDGCAAACNALGCDLPEPTTTQGTTVIQQVVTGDQPWPTPPGFPNAVLGGAGVHDGTTTATYTITNPVTLVVPTSPPPGGGVWTVVDQVVTLPAGNGQSIIFTTPVLTAAPVTCTPVTQIVTVTTAYPPITSVQLVTETVTLPPATITSIQQQPPVTLPPVPPVTITSVSVVNQPPVTITQTQTLPPITVLSTSTITSISVQPPVTNTVTVTQTVTAAPPPPPPPPPPVCSPGIYKPVTAVDVYKNAPFTFDVSGDFPTVLRVQDAGYRLEQYAVAVDGTYLASTGAVPYDRTWCDITAQSRETCEALGLSRGTFTIPAGSHRVSITNVVGISTDAFAASFSTLTYELERQCPGVPLSTASQSSCVQGGVQPWTNIDVYQNNPYKLNFNYPYSVRVRVMDAGYRTEKYALDVDGKATTLTSDYVNNPSVWCGITLPAVNNCLNSQMSSGYVVIPPGAHELKITMIAFNPATATYSTIFYIVEKFCTNTA